MYVCLFDSKESCPYPNCPDTNQSDVTETNYRLLTRHTKVALNPTKHKDELIMARHGITRRVKPVRHL